MKVLEQGNWNNPWSSEMHCSEKNCNAKLLIEEKDVQPVHYSSGFCAYCMVCGSSVHIPIVSLPKRVKDVAEKGRKHSSYGSWD